MEGLQNWFSSLFKALPDIYVKYLANDLLFNLSILSVAILFGFSFYWGAFYKKNNPIICECDQKAGIFDYKCRGLNCSNNKLLDKRILFAATGLLVMFFMIFLASFETKWFLSLTNQEIKPLTFDFFKIFTGLSSSENLILSTIFKLNFYPKLNTLIQIALIIIHLAILAFITERKFWKLFFIISSVLLLSFITQSIDYIVLLFSVAWFVAFYNILIRMRRKPIKGRLVDKFMASSFGVVDVFIIILLFIFLMVTIAENLAEISKYSIILSAFSDLNNIYNLIEIKKMLTSLSLLVILKDITSVFYFDLKILKDLLSSKENFSLKVIANIMYLFLNRFGLNLINSLSKYGLINIIISALLIIYFVLILIVEFLLISFVWKFCSLLTEYWYLSPFEWKLLPKAGVIVFAMSLIFIFVAVFLNKLYLFVALLLYRLIESYKSFLHENGSIDKFVIILENYWESLRIDVSQSRKDLKNFYETQNLAIGVILTWLWLITFLIGVFSYGFGVFQMEQFYLIITLTTLLAYRYGRFDIADFTQNISTDK